MMEAKTLPPKFWSKDIKYASYIHNRELHNNLYGMTPFESWSGHKLDVTHFRVFGSKAWARIPTEKRNCSLKAKSVYLLGIFKIKEGIRR